MRIFSAFSICVVCIFAMTFSGCNVIKPATPDLNKGFSCTADITYDGLNVTAQINRIDNGKWEIKLLSPTSLKDITLTYSAGDMTIGYKGLSFNLPENSLPVQAITNNIVNAFDNAAQGIGIEVERSDDNTKMTGKINDITYTILVAPDDTVIGLSIPDIKLEATFDGFSFADVLP